MLPVLNKAESVKLKAEKKKKKKHFPMLFVNVNFKYLNIKFKTLNFSVFPWLIAWLVFNANFSSISAILWHVFIHEVRHKAMTFNYNQILSQIEEQIAA